MRKVFSLFLIIILSVSLFAFEQYQGDIDHTGEDTATASTETVPTVNKVIWRIPTGGALTHAPATIKNLSITNLAYNTISDAEAGSNILHFHNMDVFKAGDTLTILGNDYLIQSVSGGSLQLATPLLVTVPSGTEVVKNGATESGITNISVIGSGDGYLYGYSPASGKVYWRNSVTSRLGTLFNSPAVDQTNGLIYALSNTGRLFAFNYSGEFKFAYPPLSQHNDAAPVAGPVIKNGICYITFSSFTMPSTGVAGAKVIGINSTGSVENVFSVENNETPTHMVVSSSIDNIILATYKTGGDGKIYALDPLTSLTAAWSYTAPTMKKVAHQPLVKGDNIIVTDINNNIFSISNTAESQLWTSSSYGEISNIGVIDDDKVILPYKDKFVALELLSGANTEVLYTTLAGMPANIDIASPLAFSDGKFIFSDKNGVVYQVTLDYLSSAFTQVASWPFDWSPALSSGLGYSLPIIAAAGVSDGIPGGVMIIASTDGYVYGIGDGTEDITPVDPPVVSSVGGEWSTLGSDKGRTNSLTEDDKILSGPLQPSLRWFDDLKEGITNAAVISYHTTNSQPIVIIAVDGRIHAYDASTGAKKWQYPPIGTDKLAPISSSPAINSDGDVIFSTVTGTVYVLETTDVSAILKREDVLDTPITVAPVIGKSGHIYVLTSGKYINPTGSQSTNDNIYTYTLTNNTSINGLTFKTTNTAGTLYFYDNNLADSDPIFLKEYVLNGSDGTVSLTAKLNNVKRIVWQVAADGNANVSNLKINITSDINNLTAGVTYNDYSSATPSLVNYNNIDDYRGHELHTSFAEQNIFSIMMSSLNDYTIKVVGADNILYTVGNFAGSNNPREIFIDKVIKSIHWVKNDTKVTSITEFSLKSRDTSNASAYMHVFDATGEIYQYPSNATTFLPPVNNTPAIATAADGKDILVFTTFDGKVYAVESDIAGVQGNLLTNYPLNLYANIVASPTITNISGEAYIFVVSIDGTCYLVNLASSEIASRFKLSQSTGSFTNTPTIGTGNVAYVVSTGGQIFKIDLSKLVPAAQAATIAGGATAMSASTTDAEQVIISGILTNTSPTDPAKMAIRDAGDAVLLTIEYDKDNGRLRIEDVVPYEYGAIDLNYKDGVDILFSGNTITGELKVYYRPAYSLSNYTELPINGTYNLPNNEIKLNVVNGDIHNARVYYAYNNNGETLTTLLGLSSIASVPTEVNSTPLLDSGGRLYFGGVRGALYCFNGREVIYSFMPRRPIVSTMTLDRVLSATSPATFKVAGASGFRVGDPVGIMNSDGSLLEDLGVVTGMVVPSNTTSTTVVRQLAGAALKDAEPDASSGIDLVFRVSSVANINTGDKVSILPAYNGKGYVSLGTVLFVGAETIGVDVGSHVRLSGAATNIAHVDGETTMTLTFNAALPSGVEAGLLCYRDDIKTAYYQVRSVDRNTNEVTISFYSTDTSVSNPVYPPAGTNETWYFISFPTGSEIVVGDTTTYIQVSNPPKYTREAGEMLFVQNYTAAMPLSSPVSLGTGQIIYIGGDDGVLYAIGPVGPAGVPTELPPLPEVAKIDSWNTFHADFQRTGYFGNPAPRTEALRWYRNTASKLYSSPALGFNDSTAPLGVLYQGTVDSGITSKGSLIAYNANSGGIRWRFTDQNRMGAVYSSPTVFRDERMYHFGGTYETEAIVFGTVEGSNSSYAGLRTPISVGAEVSTVEVTNASSFTVGMSVSIGSTNISNNDFLGVVRRVDTVNNILYLATKYIAPRSYLPGTQVVGMTSQQGRLYSVDRLGRLNWVFPNRTAVGDDIIAPIYSSPAVDSNGVTYFVTEDAVVYAIDLYGNMLFKEVLELPSGDLGTPDVTSAPALNLSESMLIVSAGLLGQNKGILYALDIVTAKTDERVLWAKEFDSGIFTASPMITSANGQEIIIIGTENEDDIYEGALYSIRLEDGETISVNTDSPSIGATAAAIPDNTSVSTRARKTGNNTISVDRISGIEVGTRLRLVYIGYAPEIKEVASINSVSNTITFTDDMSTDSSTNMTVYTLDRIILVPTMTGKVSAYYVNDAGEFSDANDDPLPLWSFNVSNRSIVSSPAIAKFTTSTDVHPTYTVLVGSNDFNMTAFNLKGLASNPVLLWKKNLRDRQLASPVVGPKTADNGRAIIYQASMDGYVYAFGDQINIDTDDPTNPPQDPDGPDDEYTPPSEWGDDRVPSRLSITKRIDRLMDRDFMPIPPPASAIKANTTDTAASFLTGDYSNWWKVTVVARNIGEGIIDNVKITDIIPLDLASLVEIYFEDDESALGIATRRVKTNAEQDEGIKLISFGEYLGINNAEYSIEITGAGQYSVTKIIGGTPNGIIPTALIMPGPIALDEGIMIAFTKPATEYVVGETYEFNVYERYHNSPIDKDNRESWEVVWDNLGEGYIFYGNINNQTAGIIATVPNGIINDDEIIVSDTSKFTDGMEIEFSPSFNRAVVMGIDATNSKITISKSVNLNANTVIRAVPKDRRALATTITNVTNGTVLEVDDKTELKNNMDIVFISNGRKINAKIREVSPSTNEIMLTSPVSLLAGTLITLAPPPSSRTFTFYVRVKDINDPYEDDSLLPENKPRIDITPGTEEVVVGSNFDFTIKNAAAVSDMLQGSNQLTATGNTYNGGESLPINENSQVPMYNGWSAEFISRLYYNGMIANYIDPAGGVYEYIPIDENDYILALVGAYDHNNRKVVNIFQTGGDITKTSWVKVFDDLNQVDMANGQPIYFTLPYNISGQENLNVVNPNFSDYDLSMELNINAQAATTVINVANARNNAVGNTTINRNLIVMRAPRNYGAIPYGYRLTSQQSKARIGRRNVWGRELTVEKLTNVGAVYTLERDDEWKKDITVVNPIVLLNDDGSLSTDSGKFDFEAAAPRNIKILPFTVENKSNNNMSPWNLNFRLMFDDIFLRNQILTPSVESTMLESRFGKTDGRGSFWQGLRYDPFENNSVRFTRFNATQRRGLSISGHAVLSTGLVMPIASYHPQGAFSTQEYNIDDLVFDNGRWYIPAPTNDGSYKYGRDIAVSPSSIASMRVFWDLNGDGVWQVGEPYYIKEGENTIAQMRANVEEVKPISPSNPNAAIVKNYGIHLTGPSHYSAKFARILLGNEGTRSVTLNTAIIGAQESVVAKDNISGSLATLNIFGLLSSRMQPVVSGNSNTTELFLNKRNELQWIPFNYNIPDLLLFATPVGNEVSPDIAVDIPAFIDYRQPKGYYGGNVYTYFNGLIDGNAHIFNEIEGKHTITASIVESRESFSIPEEYQYIETDALPPIKTAIDGREFNWVNYLNGNERDPVGVVIPDSGGTLGVFVISNTDDAGYTATTDSNIWYRQLRRERSYGAVTKLVPYQYGANPTVDAVELSLPIGIANKIRTLQEAESIGASTDTIDLLILVKNDGNTKVPTYAYPLSVDLAKGTVVVVPFTNDAFNKDEIYTIEIVSHPYINISDKLDIPLTLGSAFVSVNNSAPSVVVTADDKLRLSWTISGQYLDESGQRRNFSYLATRMFDPNNPTDMSTFEWIVPKNGGKGQALTTRQYVQNIPLYGMAVYEGVVENRHGLYFADIPTKVGANYRTSSIDLPFYAINNAFLNVGRPQLWMDTLNGNENNVAGSKINMIFQAESTDGNTDLYYGRLIVDNANRTMSVDTIGNAEVTESLVKSPNGRQYNSSNIAWSITNLRMYLSINNVENPTNIWVNPAAVTETEFEVSANIGGVEYRVLFNPYLGVATVRTGNETVTGIKVIGQQYLQRLTNNLAQDIAPVVVVERWQSVSLNGIRDYGFAPTLDNNPRVWVYWMRRHTDNLGVRAYYQSFRQMGGTGKLSEEKFSADNYRGGEKILPLQFLTQDSRLMAVRQSPVHFKAPVHLATATAATGADVTVTIHNPIRPGMNIWLNSATGVTRSTVLAVNGNVITLDRSVTISGTNVEINLAEDGFEAGTWIGTVIPRPLRRPVYSLDYTLPSANDLFMQIFNENVPQVIY